MIFYCHFIQPPIINAYPPICSKAGGHLFSFLIAHSGHPRFFKHNLSWTHSGAIGYGVYDTSLYSTQVLGSLQVFKTIRLTPQSAHPAIVAA